jgi:hypothetical protein
MKIEQGRFHNYVASVDVQLSVNGDRVEVRFAGQERGSRGVQLTASDARLVAYALLAEAERVRLHQLAKSN